MPVSVDLPEDMRRDLEKKKEEEYYSSMSEVIRTAIRQFLEKDETQLTRKDEAILELIKQGKVEEVHLEGEALESLQKGMEELD